MIGGRLYRSTILTNLPPCLPLAKNIWERIKPGFFISELVRPGHSFTCCGAGTFIFVLCIIGCFFVGGIAPVVPAFGCNLFIQVTIYKYSFCKRSPGSAEWMRTCN